MFLLLFFGSFHFIIPSQYLSSPRALEGENFNLTRSYSVVVDKQLQASHPTAGANEHLPQSPHEIDGTTQIELGRHGDDERSIFHPLTALKEEMLIVYAPPQGSHGQ